MKFDGIRVRMEGMGIQMQITGKLGLYYLEKLGIMMDDNLGDMRESIRVF